MPRYLAQWDYSSSLGAFAKGDALVFEPELADHINRSSPGVLVPYEEHPTLPAETIASVEQMSRDELNAFAAGFGIADPESYANADDLIAAVDAVAGARAIDAAASDPESEVTDPVDVTKLKRPQLEAYATGLGIENPSEFPNMPALVTAVQEKLAERSRALGGPPSDRMVKGAMTRIGQDAEGRDAPSQGGA